ncbi:MAG: rRNA ((1402)-2-O)-methyltransferase [Pseudomonadota bacterium]
MAARPGRLDVIATPIGNLADLSPRAREALAAADCVLAEDTRHSGQLLAACGISRPMLSLHDHNEAGRAAELVARMQSGETLALISDAGTPLMSDPGYHLVRAAAAAGLEVRSVAGPSAVTAALAVAGLPTDRFVFEGFLPARAGERRATLQRLALEPRTLVLFEAPHRVAEALADLAEAFGPARPAVVARELTKRHETVHRGTLAELAAEALRNPDVSRGEITLVVAGSSALADGDELLAAKMLPLLLKELPPARAAAITAQVSGVKKRVLYERALALAAPPG